MNIWLFLILFCSACGSYHKGSDELTHVQLIDRQGLKETLSAKERLDIIKKIDFKQPQPYQKVVRTFKRDHRVISVITQYHPNGQIAKFLETEGGRSKGKYTEWHPNGHKKVEGTLVAGRGDLSSAAQETYVFQGKATAYDEQGKPQAQFFYDKGLLEERADYFYSSGSIKKTIPYTKDKIHGRVKTFCPEGIQIATWDFEHGVLNGKAQGTIHEDHPRFKEEYDQGKLITGVYYDAENQQIGSIEKGTGTKPFYKQGVLIRTVAFIDGVINGYIKEFNTEGNLVVKYQMKDQKKEGETCYYYPPDAKNHSALKLLVPYKNDNIHGVVKSYYPSGKIESEKELSENKKQGLYCAWYEDGSLMIVEEYDKDILVEGKYMRKGDPFPLSKVSQGKGTATFFDLDGRVTKRVEYDKGKPQLQ